MWKHTAVCNSMHSLSVCLVARCFDDADKSPPPRSLSLHLVPHNSPPPFSYPYQHTHTHTIYCELSIYHSHCSLLYAIIYTSIHTVLHTVHTVTTIYTSAAYLPQSTIFETLDLHFPFNQMLHAPSTTVGMQSVIQETCKSPLNQKFGTSARKELWPMHFELCSSHSSAKRGVKA